MSINHAQKSVSDFHPRQHIAIGERLKYNSGTSLASPLVAGIIAVIGTIPSCYMVTYSHSSHSSLGASEEGTALAKDPKKMKEYILASAAKGKITGLSAESHNLLLQSPFQAKINLELSETEKKANGDYVPTDDETEKKANQHDVAKLEGVNSRNPLKFLEWLIAGWKRASKD